jgi:hypothetical protein
VADGERLAGLQVDTLFERTMTGEEHEHVVIAGLDVQTLEDAVEVVDGARVIAIDVLIRFESIQVYVHFLV